MKFAKLLLQLSLAMIALIVVAELLVRFVTPQPLDPGHSFVVKNEIPGLKPRVEFAIDANHIRGFNSRKRKPEGALRVLCIGGGATTTMLQNVEDTWWGRVGSELESALDKPVQIGSLVTPAAGVAIGGAQWCEHLLEKIDGVDLVIAMYGHEDLLMPRADFSFDPNSIREIEFEHRGSFASRLAKSSHLVRIARNAHVKSKRSAHKNLIAAPNYIRDRFVGSSAGFRTLTKTTAAPPRITDPIAAYLHGLGLFIESAKRHEVGLMIVGEPTVFSVIPSPDAAGTLNTPVHVGPGANDFARPLPDWVDRELGRYYTAAKQLCDGAGVSFVGLQGVVLPNRNHFFTETTLTDKGAAAVARELLPQISVLVR